MTASEGALLIVALCIAWSVYRADRATNAFNLLDLLMENGRVSRIACAFLVTLVVTSWAVVHLTVLGKLTEGIFIGYGGMWVAPIVAKLFSTNQPPAEVKP